MMPLLKVIGKCYGGINVGTKKKSSNPSLRESSKIHENTYYEKTMHEFENGLHQTFSFHFPQAFFQPSLNSK